MITVRNVVKPALKSKVCSLVLANGDGHVEVVDVSLAVGAAILKIVAKDREHDVTTLKQRPDEYRVLD